MKTLQRCLLSAVQAALAVARRVLPAPVMRRLSGRASAIVAAISTPVGASFENRATALKDVAPILPPSAFAQGQILFANAALAWGGAERQLVNTMTGLAKRGVASSLLCLRLHEDSDLDFFVSALADHNGFVRNAMAATQGETSLSRASPAHLERLRAAIAWLPLDVQADIFRFAGEFAALKPSVVHAWQDATSIAAGYAARLIGVPRMILSARSVAPANFHYQRPYMADAYRELCDCPSVVLLNNSEAGASDYARWLGIAKERIVVLRNGFDADAVRRPDDGERNALRDKLGIPMGAPVVGTIIRFSPVKQPMLWAATAANVARARPDCHFVIFGTGPLREDVIAFAKREGFADRLHCPGTIVNVAAGLSLFSVFLLTSQVEGTPNVVLEASLLGIPVVATAVGGTAETLVQGETGFAVEPAADRLATAVLAALNDPATAERASRQGPAFVRQRFGLSRMLDETLALYHRA